MLWIKNKGVIANGYESENGFVVKNGSTAVIQTVDSVPPYTLALRQEMLASGILRQKDECFYQFTQDYEFSSPSAAAAALLGASINGREWWKTSDGASLKLLQERAGGESAIAGE